MALAGPAEAAPALCFGWRKDFGGERIHVLQVGLGNNGTFLQNLTDSGEEWDRTIGCLLQAVSERQPARFKGVGVEPVEEHLQELLRGPAAALPHVALVQAALGEVEAEGVDMRVLTRSARDALVRRAPEGQREDIRWNFEFLRNMSCVGQEHPDFAEQRAWLRQLYDLDVSNARRPPSGPTGAWRGRSTSGAVSSSSSTRRAWTRRSYGR